MFFQGKLLAKNTWQKHTYIYKYIEKVYYISLVAIAKVIAVI